LMKKSLTFRLWKNSQVDPNFLWCASCRVRHCRAAWGHGLWWAGARHSGR